MDVEDKNAAAIEAGEPELAAIVSESAVMRLVAEDVHEALVPDSGHWVMEENPLATAKLVTDFLKSPR